MTTKEQLTTNFYNNHKQVNDYVNSLTEEQFMYSYSEKWTAGQQFSHVYLTLLSFPQILPFKDLILNKFGEIDRPTSTLELILEKYLKTSRKAPEKYLPQEIIWEQKKTISNSLESITIQIKSLLLQYTEKELDTLVLPHPLLGNMTIREMFI